MSNLKRYRADILVVAGLIILPLLVFFEVTIGSQTMVPADNLVQWEPWQSASTALGVESPHNALISDLLIENFAWKRFINQSVAEGEIPLWNPYLFAGAPFLATGQNAGYYPFSLLFMVLPLTKAYGWFTVSQLWLAGVLAYLFGRVLDLRPSAGAMVGLVYQGCGFMMVSAAVFPMIISAAAWLPLLLASIEMVIRNSTSPAGAGKTFLWAAAGAIGLGFLALAGHVEIIYYSLLVMAVFAAWRLGMVLLQAKRRPEMGWLNAGRVLIKPAGWLLTLVLIGLMFGAIQLIPLFEVAQQNFREGSASLAEVRGWAFPVRRIITLGMPDFFGNPSHHDYRDLITGEEVKFTLNAAGESNPNGAGTSDWGIKNYVEGGIYLGILPVFLAILGVSSWRRWVERRGYILFFLVLAFFSLSFIFGTPLYALLYYGLPGINQLHSPFRWVFPLSLCVAVLAGFGLDALIGWNKEKSWRAATILALIAGGSGFVILSGLFVTRLFFTQFEPLITRVFLNLAKATEAFPDARAFYSYESRNILILGMMLLGSGVILWWGTRRIRHLRWWPIVALILVGLDLFLIHHYFHAAADPQLLDYQPELVEWLQNQDGHWRFTTFTPHGDKPFNANVGWLYDLQDIRGYDSIIPRQYTDYMAAIEPQNELLFNRVQPIVNWEALNSPLLDLLGAKFIISTAEIELPKLVVAWEQDNMVVYENLASVPRAYSIPFTATKIVTDALSAMQEQDPRQFVFVDTMDWAGEETPAGVPAELNPATITAYGGNEVMVETIIREPSWLVLNDSYFSGWKAFIRPVGEPEAPETEVPITRVNANFRGVILEPGSWQVRFRYSPLSFKLGGLTSAMGGIILLFAALVWGWRRLYNPDIELTNTRSIAKNSLVPTFLNLLNRFIDFLFAAFYLRLLGPADAGSYATAIAIAGWFEIISNFGLNTLVIREVSQERGSAAHYLLNTTLVRLATTLVGSLPIFIYLTLVTIAGNPLGVETVAAILLLMVGMLFSGIGQSLTGLFYAFEQAEVPAAIATVTTILKVGFGVLVLVLGYGFVGLAGVSIIVNVLTLGVLAAALYRRIPLPGPWRVDWSSQRRMLNASYPLMLNHLLANIFFFIDVPMMQQINGSEAVGWYNSAYKWINAINVIPSFFTFALFPVISRQIASAQSDARRTFRMAVKIMMLIALPIAAITTLMAPLLIGILGGQEFLPEGALALQIVIWSIPAGWINSVTNYVLIALGQERVQVRAFLIGVTFNVVLNLIFLPRFGFVAAAVTTILSEFVLLFVFNLYLRQRMENVGWLSLVWRPVAVTVIMAAVMVLGAQLHLMVGLIAGILVYPTGLWLMGSFGEDERHVLQSILPDSLATRLKLVSNK